MRVLWLSGLVVIIDQLTKAAVLEYMYRGQSIPLVGDWLKFTFTENPGMAFGLQVGPKGTVTVLALLAMGLVAYYFYHVRNAYLPYRLSLAFIFGGAIGNIIDRIFYGVFLGYGELFRGKVVDFIHVSVWKGWIPESVPVYGGAYVDLFPIWNVADMAIVGGVVGVLFFHHTFHERELRRLKRESMQIVAVEAPRVDFALPPLRAYVPHGLHNGNGRPAEPGNAQSSKPVEPVADRSDTTSTPA
ncbi:peptidase A8 [Longibacter salinarum]|uniref:Lipoprotein signal peptidase n=1 Tax=Longibacter salinarum TaxID=1850348 RepID=A0A2A8CXS1_9BACT|nr:signal peptidase II [Longibacter salinarum]PEN13456.1 peptidase A8 [Longibacter salinarum]